MSESVGSLMLSSSSNSSSSNSSSAADYRAFRTGETVNS